MAYGNVWPMKFLYFTKYFTRVYHDQMFMQNKYHPACLQKTG